MLLRAVISWLGLVVHNVADLPGQMLASPETLYPSLVWVLLLALYRFGSRRIGAGALLVWAILNLVGGGVISVLPLSILPFQPEQTPRHYSFHALYALTQVPLLLAALRELGDTRRTRPTGATV